MFSGMRIDGEEKQGFEFQKIRVMSLFMGERGCHDWKESHNISGEEDDFIFLDLGLFYNSLLIDI